MKSAGNANDTRMPKCICNLATILNFIVCQYQLIRAKPFIFMDFGERKIKGVRDFFPPF
jgi:hypothetical protein